MAECSECGSKLKNSSHLTLSLHWLDCPVILKKVQEFKETLKAEEDVIKAQEEMLKAKEDEPKVTPKIEKTSSYIHSHLSEFLFED